jgi:hypothetical protein
VINAMRDGKQISDFVEERIGHVFRRPLMYGGTPEGVDVVLDYYHELWALIHERGDEFEKVSSAAHDSEGCGSMNFAYRYQRDHPAASVDESARYVVSMWRRIGEKLGLSAGGSRLERVKVGPDAGASDDGKMWNS